MYSIYKLTEIRAWSERLHRIGNVDIYYYPQYVAPFELHGDGEATLFFYESTHGTAYMVFHLRDLADIADLAGKIPKRQIYDVITPYGYGGMQFSSTRSEFVDEVYDAFDEYCERQGVIFEFVRFHPMNENYAVCRNKYQIYLERKTIYMDLRGGPDRVWTGLKSENRTRIRKAMKSSVIVKSGPLDEYIDDFRRIYYQTMDRNKARNYYYFHERFFDACSELQGHCARIFAAQYQDKIISTSIILFKDKSMYYHLGGSETEAMHLAPHNLVLWEAAKWGCEKEINFFHLGGGLTDNDNDSLYRFKESFSRSGVSIATQGYRIINKEKYARIVDLFANPGNAERIRNNPGFMPPYRV